MPVYRQYFLKGIRKMQEKKIEGIVCHVETCEYHAKDDRCNAGKISVGGCTACDCTDTCCNTFKAKH